MILSFDPILSKCPSLRAIVCSSHTMPEPSIRSKAIRALEPLILSQIPYRHLELNRRRLRVLIALYRHITSARYWDRYPEVNANLEHPSFYHHPIAITLERGTRHYHAFRMDHAQLFDITSLFEHDPIFQSQGRKPQAPPLYQIALFVFRMAHGHTMHALESIFHISSV